MQDRYDEIDNLILTLETLENEITSKDILEDIRYLKYEYEDEKNELEQRLIEEQQEEYEYQSYQYNEMRI